MSVSQTGPLIDTLQQDWETLPPAQCPGTRLVMAICPRGIEVFWELRRARAARRFGK